MEVFNAFPEVACWPDARQSVSEIPSADHPESQRTPGVSSAAKRRYKRADGFHSGSAAMPEPGLIRQTGYWSEENGFGDAELSRGCPLYGLHGRFYHNGRNRYDTELNLRRLYGQSFCTLNRSLSDCFSLCRLTIKTNPLLQRTPGNSHNRFRSWRGDGARPTARRYTIGIQADTPV
jgi:hypothetical protein